MLKILHRANQSSAVTTVEWKIVSTASGLAVGVVVRRLVNWAWSALSPSDHEPPLNPADGQITWIEAVAWAAAAGAGVRVARLVSERVAASGWELATGAPPPVDSD